MRASLLPSYQILQKFFLFCGGILSRKAPSSPELTHSTFKALRSPLNLIHLKFSDNTNPNPNPNI